MKEQLCHWCKVNEATSGLKYGERYCSTCDPYAWSAFMNPETYEENKRIALSRAERRLFVKEAAEAVNRGALAELVASEQEASPSRKVLIKELVVARIAFVGMFLAVLVAVSGIFIVGGGC